MFSNKEYFFLTDEDFPTFLKTLIVSTPLNKLFLNCYMIIATNQINHPILENSILHFSLA